MPYRPHIIGLVETGLAECFQYHGALDSFVTRAGVSQARLRAARDRAEERNKKSARGFSRAPKRIVVQELLADLSSNQSGDDRIMAALITGLCNGNFPEATPDGQAAVDGLKAQRVVERQEAADRRAEEERKRREVEQKAERASAELARKRDGFRQSFLALCELQDPQQRGYALERFLNGFLDFEHLNPRASFKLCGCRPESVEKCRRDKSWHQICPTEPHRRTHCGKRAKSPILSSPCRRRRWPMARLYNVGGPAKICHSR